jgi:hypothetical protein
MIADILEILKKGDFYGGGRAIEIAKGKHELVTDWKSVRYKIKRQWRSRGKS